MTNYLGLYYGSTAYSVVMALLLLWSLPWKGVALWRAAKKNHTVWFIVFLILNTIGILEILYIFVFSKMKEGEITVEEKNWLTKLWEKILRFLGIKKS
ncbi:MAG: DUF5652 family protein [Patescibacteria group bacterium]|nr:DUF5652 family protein [Patescibacteria group bacterium]MDD5121071.1 DUF5652 family protein [Patescibacteria group bacterium]MDD5221567.1 DUF5652 family protein [Patescibacteria group bacterium]MDD5396010.1 DUF5652 family protein [Patescibacteria group bacterium]